MTRQTSLKLYLAIIATGIMSFCGILIETAMNVTFPKLIQQFGIDTATVQWLTTGYLLVVAIIVPISGFLKARFTTKKLFLVANAFFITGLLICTLTNRFDVLLLGRLIQGCGTGIALPLMFNIILEQAPLAKLGFFMGIGVLVTAIAPALGPTYGGILVTINWHLIFGILLIFIIIAFFLGLFSITQATPPKPIPLDWLSWGLLALFFGTAILGLNSLSDQATRALILGIVAVFALAAFIYRSLKVSTPLINLKIMTNSVFNRHLYSYFAFQVLNVCAAFLLPNYLQIVTRTSSYTAGLLLMPGAAIAALLAPFSGSFFDRFGASKPIITGLICQLASIVLLLVTALYATPVIIMLGYLLMMLGTSFAFGNIMTNGMTQVAKADQAAGNALFNTVQQFGGAVGTAIISLILALAQQTGAYRQATAIGAQHGYYFMLFIALTSSILIISALRRTQVGKKTAK